MHPAEILKRELAGGRPDPLLVPVERYFRDNDDLGSIGCNLIEHPGIDVFRDLLVGLTRRPDVAGVFVRIAELDPGEGCWPFADSVYVIGTIAPEDLGRILAPLLPDEVVAVPLEMVPTELGRPPAGARVLSAWWD